MLSGRRWEESGTFAGGDDNLALSTEAALIYKCRSDGS